MYLENISFLKESLRFEDFFRKIEKVELMTFLHRMVHADGILEVFLMKFKCSLGWIQTLSKIFWIFK